MAPKRCLKRPSAATVGHLDPPERPEWVEKQLAAVLEVEQVDWATHMAKVLTVELRAFSKQMGGQVMVNLWCDFAGMATEVFAAQRIKESLVSSGLVVNFAFRVFLACDNDSHSRDFIEVNHSPAHMACDVDERDFGTGTLCTTAGDTLQMPRGGVDIYVACFPCGPFSPRGKRLGLDDKHGMCYTRAIETIEHIQPASYIMENLCTLTHQKAAGDASSNIDVITEYSRKRLPNYDVATITKIDPTHNGYCQRKPRLLQVGLRNGIAPQGRLADKCERLLTNPAAITMNYRQFLKLDDADVSWHRFNCLPAHEERLHLLGQGCTCSLDPRKTCDVHRCKCEKCRGILGPPKCQWRLKAVLFIEKNFDRGIEEFLGNGNDERLTYCNILQLHGKSVSTRPREINMLNIAAHLPKCQPLDKTLAILDMSQGIDWLNIQTDGTVQTMATNSTMLCLQDGHILTEMQMATLMGHICSTLKFRHTSANQFKKLIGNCVHVSVMGLAVFAILGSLAVN